MPQLSAPRALRGPAQGALTDMEPRIQYAETENGVNTVCLTMGKGDPLVHEPWPGG